MTELGSGQVTTPVVSDVQADQSSGTDSPAKTDAVDITPSDTSTTVDAKDWRKSNKEWQDMVEKTRKAEEVLHSQKEIQDVSIQETFSEVQRQKQEIERLKWELEHPVVRDSKYREEWEAVNKEERYATLTHEERFRLIQNQDSQLQSALIDQVKKLEGSVVPASGAPVSSPTRPSSDLLESGKAWGFTEQDYVKYGVL